MSDTTIIKTAMNEAYWQAARAVCEQCAKNWPLEKLTYSDGTIDRVHMMPHEQLGVYAIECDAAPIHALIEKLSGVQE